MRIVAMIVGLTGAGICAQAPEFSQQYLQRLAGAVDELAVVVADFDRSAADAGLTRAAALDELSGTSFLEARNADMRRNFARYERLSADLSLLRAATAIERAALTPARLDPEIASRAWADFEPGLPLTSASAGLAAVGFLAGFGLWAGISGMAFATLRRLRRKRPV